MFNWFKRKNNITKNDQNNVLVKVDNEEILDKLKDTMKCEDGSYRLIDVIIARNIHYDIKNSLIYKKSFSKLNRKLFNLSLITKPPVEFYDGYSKIILTECTISSDDCVKDYIELKYDISSCYYIEKNIFEIIKNASQIIVERKTDKGIEEFKTNDFIKLFKNIVYMDFYNIKIKEIGKNNYFTISEDDIGQLKIHLINKENNNDINLSELLIEIYKNDSIIPYTTVKLYDYIFSFSNYFIKLSDFIKSYGEDINVNYKIILIDKENNEIIDRLPIEEFHKKYKVIFS